MEYFNYNNKLKPKKGCLLLSEPFLPDPNFERTVVLLCEHNEEGSFGFIMNKPSLVTLEDIMDDMDDISARVYVGGPVQQNTFHFIHKIPEIESSIKVLNGIYWGGNFDQIKELILKGQVNKNDCKFFVGYSGWDEQQLLEEIDTGSWIVSYKINSHLLFNDTHYENLWKSSIKSLGGRFNIYSNYPVDPRLN